ncbi:MAG: YceI family protein, partial [Flavobacteriaceae bacterium]|nr:YceI family protein [Flavobacteriaceae bacterium]
LDKNAYKALESDDYADIIYTLTEVESIRLIGDNEYKVNTKGLLNIKGSKQQVALSFDIRIEQGKLKIKGSKTLNMTAFGVEPPTALLGTIKTAEEIEILFDVVYQ